MRTAEANLYFKEVGDIVITSTQPQHARQLQELQEIVFPTLAKESLIREVHYLNHIKVFPEGQFVAKKGERVIGMTTTMRDTLNLHVHHSFSETFGDGMLNNHQPHAEWMHGLDIGTHPEFRGLGIAQHLYAARQETVYKLGLKGQYTYGMLTGYGVLKGQLTPQEYYQQVVEGKRKDPTVSRQMKCGFKPYGLIPNYVDDPVCDGYAALLIQINDQYPNPIKIQ
jgi:GNAT superfamily N-acetyltransferase